MRGEAVQLTRTQFALLACFARHPGRLLTHRAIVAEVWGDPDAAAADNLRVQSRSCGGGSSRIRGTRR